MRGYEDFRQAVIDAVHTLGYEADHAGNYGASTDTPQRALTAAVRAADLTVLLLGERYGEPQQSGLSATHEGFREARDHRHIIAFVQAGVELEGRQRGFIREVQEWAGGKLTEEYETPAELGRLVTAALHRHAIRQATGPADAGEMHSRARGALPRDQQGMYSGGGPRLHVVVAGGPHQQVVRPAVLDPSDLGPRIHQQAMFGPHRVFDSGQGVEPRLQGDRLVVAQPDRMVELHEDGTVVVSMPATQSGGRGFELSLIEEDIRDRLDASIGFAAWLLDQVDHLHRLSDVVVLAAIYEAGFTGWRTRTDAAGGAVTISHTSRDGPVVVPPSPRRHPRAALTADADTISADLVALFRRTFA